MDWSRQGPGHVSLTWWAMYLLWTGPARGQDTFWVSGGLCGTSWTGPAGARTRLCFLGGLWTILRTGPAGARTLSLHVVGYVPTVDWSRQGPGHGLGPMWDVDWVVSEAK